MNNRLKWIMDYVIMSIGCFIIAMGLVLFLAPHTIAPGGVTGLAIVVQTLTGIPISVTNLAVNIPLFVLGVFFLGKTFGAKTAFGAGMLSIMLYGFERYASTATVTGDLLLAAVFGGILTGAGIGLVFRQGGTTGGTDLAAAILKRFFPQLSLAKLMMLIDLLVVISAGIVHKSIETALYSMIALYIIVKVADFFVEGMNYSKSLTIITDHPDVLSSAIITKVNRGVTFLSGKGMYTGSQKGVLLCVVSRAEVAKVKAVAAAYDPKAFITVSTVHEVLGEGFKEID